MVLIPKQKRTETVENPFRPKIGIPKEHSSCKIGWADYHIEYDEVERRLSLDCDHNDEFLAEMEATIPKEDRWKCLDKEIWLIRKEWKTFLLGLAKKYYDEVTTQLRDWK